MPPIVLAAIPVIEAVIKYAPQLASTYKNIRDFITTLFTSKVISAQQQDELHAWVDKIQAAWLAGQVPSHWTVEADPPSK